MNISPIYGEDASESSAGASAASNSGNSAARSHGLFGAVPLGHISKLMTCGYSYRHASEWARLQVMIVGVQVPSGHSPTCTPASLILGLGQEKHWLAPWPMPTMIRQLEAAGFPFLSDAQPSTLACHDAEKAGCGSFRLGKCGIRRLRASAQGRHLAQPRSRRAQAAHRDAGRLPARRPMTRIFAYQTDSVGRRPEQIVEQASAICTRRPATGRRAACPAATNSGR